MKAITQWSRTTQWFAGIIVSVFFVTMMLIAINGNKIPQPAQTHYINDNASADNKVEALKTMTADLLAVEANNKQLSQQIAQLQTQDKQSQVTLQQSLSNQVQQAVQQINLQNQQALEEKSKKKETAEYVVNGDHNDQGSFTWVSDLSAAKNPVEKAGNKSLFNLTNTQISSSHSVQKKITISPQYTIPVNASLTGATLMTPLIGRVPIDGQLPSPYHFKLVLSANNLTANGYPLPGVKGAVMSGVASGDLLGRCARGDIQSITFVFNDGRISTSESKGNDETLAYISTQSGDPCIAGTLHSDAALFLGAQMGLAGVEGYANAITNSQYMNATTPEGAGIRTLMGNANKAALGQGGSAAAMAAQTWWDRRVQNSFDYIYVPNVDPTTGQAMKLVVNIMQQIAINYDKSARKVSYENVLSIKHHQLD